MVVPISTSGVPFVVNDGGQGANWKQGETIEARVTGVFSSGLARLTTQGASFDLTLPVKVGLGDTVRLKIEGQGDTMRFVFVDARSLAQARPGAGTPLPRTGDDLPVPRAVPGSAAHQAGGTTLSEPGSLAPQQTAPTPLGAFGAMVHQILPVLAGRQDSIAALFANLHALSNAQAAALPREAQQSMRNLASMGIRIDPPVTGGQVRQLAGQSGIFWEAGIFTGNATPQKSDVKAQLLILKASLAQFLGKDAPTRPSAENAPPPPRAGANPVGQSAAGATITPQMNAAQVAVTLQADVEAALSRIRLLQIASLGSSEEGHFRPHSQEQSEWRFEIPILLPGGTSVSEIMISHDGGHGADEEKDGRHWRLQFSVDLPETGRIDSLVGLHGERISVGIWADRQGMADLLATQSEILRLALEEAGLAVDEISVSQGEPLVAASRSGYFVDWTA